MESILPGTPETQKSPERSLKAKQWMKYLGLGAIVLLFALLNVFIYRYSQGITREKLGLALFERLRKKPQQLVVAPTPTPSPTPTPYPIAQGRQVYNVNTNAKSGPRLIKVTIDPLDARIGETQTIDVTVKSTSIVSGVMVAMRTDKNVLTNHKLVLTSGTGTDGIWSASWRTEVIHDYLYQVIITATDTETSNSTTVTIR